MKHNGINATRDVLKDQLVLAAVDKMAAAESEALWRELAYDWRYVANAFHECALEYKALAELGPLARLARWARRAWA